MFIEFFYELRRRKVPVASTEWMTLMRALELGLHDSSLDGFYHLARLVCVKDLAHYDAFDAAFLSVFKGIERQALEITDEIHAWLSDPKNFAGLTDEQIAAIKALSLDDLRALYEQRLREQKERHDG